MIRFLVKLGNKLDRLGHQDGADLVDIILQKLAGKVPHDEEWEDLESDEGDFDEDDLLTEEYEPENKLRLALGLPPITITEAGEPVDFEDMEPTDAELEAIEQSEEENRQLAGILNHDVQTVEDVLVQIKAINSMLDSDKLSSEFREIILPDILDILEKEIERLVSSNQVAWGGSELPIAEAAKG